ncbi:MAG: SPOR domain-containing protein [Pseudomonadota bacterium]
MVSKKKYQFFFSKKHMVFMSTGIFFAFILVFTLGFLISKEFYQSQPDRVKVKSSIEPKNHRESKTSPNIIRETEGDHSDLDLTFYQTLLDKEATSLKQNEQTNNIDKIPQTVDLEKQEKSSEIKQRAPKELKANIKPLKGYTVQIGAFQDKEEARKMADKLEKKGYPVYIVSSNIPTKGIMHRVRVGHYDNIEDAKKLGLTIEMKESLPTYITFSAE